MPAEQRGTPVSSVKRRVAIVFTQLTYGGSERQTVELLKRVKGTEWEPVIVICLSEELYPYGAAIRSLGYRLLVLSRRANFEVGRLSELRRVLREERIDIAHAVGLLASAYTWLAAVTSRGVKTRVLPTMRSGVVPTNPVRRLLYRVMLKLTPVTLANSHSGAALLRTAFGLKDSQLAVVPNGLDIAELRERASAGGLRQLLGLGTAQERIVGFIGKDAPVKNVPLFIEVFKRVLASHPSVHGVVIGQQLGEEARARLASDVPADRLHFLGTRADVPALLSEMDVLILTSRSEGCPNVVLEALAVGTPVVAAAVGDIPVILDKVNCGSVIETAEPEDYAAAVLRWLPRNAAGPRAEPVHLGWLENSYGMTAMVTRTTEIWKALTS